MEIQGRTKYERPAAGFFLGRVIDVVEMPGQFVKYSPTPVDKVAIVWVLGTLDGRPYLDKTGKPFTVRYTAPSKITPKSNLGKALTQILGGYPSHINIVSTDQLWDLLKDRVAQLSLVKNENEEDPSDPYTNILGYAPVMPGQIPPSTPEGFIRDKFAPKTVGGQVTYSTPQVAAAAQQAFQPAPPTVAPAGQPQFTPEQIAAFLKFQQSQQASNTVSLEQPKVNQPF